MEASFLKRGIITLFVLSNDISNHMVNKDSIMLCIIAEMVMLLSLC